MLYKKIKNEIKNKYRIWNILNLECYVNNKMKIKIEKKK